MSSFRAGDRVVVSDEYEGEVVLIAGDYLYLRRQGYLWLHPIYIPDATVTILESAPPEPPTRWDIGDPQPADPPTLLQDHTHEFYDPRDSDSPRWVRTFHGEWKGYKNGGKVYLGWEELTRRWGPLTAGDQ